MDISFIIPCFNEESNVENFFEVLKTAVSPKNISFECVFVNDGSFDKTRQNLKSICENNPQSDITVVNFSRNFGKEAAILAGLQNSSGKYSCIIDADLQQRPEVAIQMYEIIAADSSFDCVCAFQQERKENRLMTVAKSAFYKTINKMASTDFKNGASDFRVFNEKVKQALLSLPEKNRFSKGIFSFVGFNTYYLEYKADDRNAGNSKWTPLKLLKYGVGGILSFSNAPLILPLYIGTVSSFLSVLTAIILLVITAIRQTAVNPLIYIALLVFFLFGIIMISVGILGEYIGKIYNETKNRPVYIVDEVVKNDKKGKQ